MSRVQPEAPRSFDQEPVGEPGHERHPEPGTGIAGLAGGLGLQVESRGLAEPDARARRRAPTQPDELRLSAVDRSRGRVALPQRRRGRSAWTWMIIWLGVLAGIGGTVYYGVFATNRYVTEAHFTVRTADPAESRSSDNGSHNLGLGSSAGAAISDSFIVAEYLRSSAAVADIGRELDLRAMFSPPNADFLSRLDPTSSQEALASYWRRRVGVDYDPMTATVALRTEAFTAGDALKLSQAALAAAERLVNRLSDQTRSDALRFAQQEVQQAEVRLATALDQLAKFQNARSAIDPQRGANSQQDLIAKLQGDLATSRAALATMTSLGTSGPMRRTLQAKIAATEAQIRLQQLKLTQSGGTIDKTTASSLISDVQRLQVEVDFAQKNYSAALDALQGARQDAARTQRYVVTFISPALPTQPVEPDRPRMIATTWFIAVISTGVIGLLLAAIREHLL